MLDSTFAPAGQQPEPRLTTADHVAAYRADGLAVCRLHPQHKRPTDAGWPTRSAEPADFRAGDGVGLLCGSLSDAGRPGCSLVCVDLDSTAAVAAADRHLPPTGMVDGRPGKPRAHRWYLVPNDSIPGWATSAAPQAAAAAIERCGHPGPFVKHIRGADGQVAIDFLGTGGQAAVPPSLWTSPDGQRTEPREWEGGERGEPAVVSFQYLWEAVGALARSVGCTPLNGPPTADPGPPAGAGRRAAGCGPPCGTGTGIVPADAEREINITPELIGRAERYLAAVPDADLSRAGRGGHDTLFRHASAVANGLGVRDPGVLADLLERGYNARLRALDAARPGEGFEPWSVAELEHKIRDALAAGPPPGKEPGWLLGGGADDPPRGWDDPARLAREVAAEHHFVFVQDAAYQYVGAAYRAVSDDALRALVQTRVEGAAEAEYRRLVGRWEAAEGVSAAWQALDADGAAAAFVDRAAAERAVRRHASGRPDRVPRVSGRLVGETVWSLKALRRLPDRTPFDVLLPAADPRPWLTVGNGILDLGPGGPALLPHTRDWFARAALPVQFDPAAPPPARWLEFLREVMEGDTDRVGLLQEVTGWCLDRESGVQAFVVAVGPGGNGKSVFFHVLRQLLGPANTAAVGLDQLSGRAHRFAAHELLGRLANLKADQGYFESEDESVLKELTGGDEVMFEAKGRQPVFAPNRAKLLFGCNQLPRFRDRSDGVWRRLVPVPFAWAVPPARRDPTMLAPGRWAAELPGVLNWALAGLARLRARGRFELPAACGELAAQHRLDSNPARAFLAERYQPDPAGGGFVPSAGLYQEYRKWCADSGYDHPLPAVPFGREVASQFPAARSCSRRVGFPAPVRGWSGLRPSGTPGVRGTGPPGCNGSGGS